MGYRLGCIPDGLPTALLFSLPGRERSVITGTACVRWDLSPAHAGGEQANGRGAGLTGVCSQMATVITYLLDLSLGIGRYIS